MRTLADINHAIAGAARTNNFIAMDLSVLADLMCHVTRLEAALGEIASGLSVRHPFDIANEALQPSS